MTISGQRKWRSSERIALSLLEQLGYKIIDTHVKIRVDGTEIAEIDAVAEDEEGERYAVEIKAGRIDITGVRQAYVNAHLLGAKPLVVAKGYADDAAAALAEKLGVKIIQLSDYYLVEAEELETLIREAIGSLLAETLTALANPPPITPEEKRVIEAVASSTHIAAAAEKLSMKVKELGKILDRMRNKGIFPRHYKQYYMLRYHASIILLSHKLRILEEILKHCAEETRGPGDNIGAP